MVVVGISLQFHRYYLWEMLEHGCCGDFSANSIDIMPNAGAWMMLGVCPKVAHAPGGLTEVMIIGHEAVGDNRERS